MEITDQAIEQKVFEYMNKINKGHLPQIQMPPPQQQDIRAMIGRAFKEQFFKPELEGKVSDIDSIKLTTMGISSELTELRRAMMTHNASSKDKEAEILRLQLKL